MAAHLLVLYPRPKDPQAFDRAYREEHLPYAGPRLAGATGVATRRVVGAAAPSYQRVAMACRMVLMTFRMANRTMAMATTQASVIASITN